MKQKCRNNQCLRMGEWQNGLCNKCTLLIQKGFTARKREAKKKKMTLKRESQNAYPNALKRAKAAFQRLRRIQEADENGIVKCVHGSVRKWEHVQGGHYFPSFYLYTCFHPDNVWPQEAIKNYDMQNPETQNEYRNFLLQKIGAERLAFLETHYRLPIKYSTIELNALAERWENEAKELINKKFKK